MARADAPAEVETAPPLPYAAAALPPLAAPGYGGLSRELGRLALPILLENMLHMAVGLTDVYLAGHLRHDAAAATAAIGAVGYVLWLLGLLTGAIGVGSTAIIARAVGARHRSLANKVCGQSIGAAAGFGVLFAGVCYAFAGPFSRFAGLSGEAQDFTHYYFQVLALSLPFTMLMYTAGACLRGAGDTLTPAVAMIVVDGVNVIASAGLTMGLWGLPEMGFRGIAIGTVIAYTVGGVLLIAALLRGSGGKGNVGIRLHVHRLRPHWLTLRRIARIGLPSGAGEAVAWAAQFAIIMIINRMDPTNVAASAHILTVRVESLSYLAGYAISIAAATMVGQSLGMNNPARAARSAYLSYGLGAGIMAVWGFVFLLFGRPLAGFFNGDPATVDLAVKCLRVTALVQIPFAAALVFSGALRGAGDTVTVMGINLASTLGLRLTGVLVAVLLLGHGLVAIWVVLAGELTVRGMLMFLRFRTGGWRHVRV